jgi:hypothetical protein
LVEIAVSAISLVSRSGARTHLTSPPKTSTKNLLRRRIDDGIVVEEVGMAIRNRLERVDMTNHDRDDVLSTATDRFERRLAEESGGHRAEVAETRLEVARLRSDMTEQFATVRVQAETRHAELLKWALLFWIAQAGATAAIVRALA